MSFPLLLSIPSVRGHFGMESLYTFQTQISPDQIIDLLGHDPRNENRKKLSEELRELYSKIQRKLSTPRRDQVVGYLEDRLLESGKPGAFPAICVGMTQPPIFEPGTGVYPDMGILKMDTSVRNTRILLDGLGRVSGSLEFIENNPKAKGAFSIPLTIFAPHEKHSGGLTLLELGQLFFDFNFRVHPISKAHAMKLDQSDLYLMLCNDLGKSRVIELHGGMEVGRQSLGSKSTGIVVQQVLLRFVRGACEGGKFQKSNKEVAKNPNLTRDAYQDIAHNLESFIELFAEELGEKFGDRQFLHLSSVGWQALGLVAHDLYFKLPELDSVERTRFIQKIARLDWSRQNKEMIKIGVLSDVDGQIGLSGRGVAAVEALYHYIVVKAEIEKLVKEAALKTQAA